MPPSVCSTSLDVGLIMVPLASSALWSYLHVLHGVGLTTSLVLATVTPFFGPFAALPLSQEIRQVHISPLSRLYVSPITVAPASWMCFLPHRNYPPGQSNPDHLSTLQPQPGSQPPRKQHAYDFDLINLPGYFLQYRPVNTITLSEEPWCPRTSSSDVRLPSLKLQYKLSWPIQSQSARMLLERMTRIRISVLPLLYLKWQVGESHSQFLTVINRILTVIDFVNHLATGRSLRATVRFDGPIRRRPRFFR
jgi:hypothetical protein